MVWRLAPGTRWPDTGQQPGTDPCGRVGVVRAEQGFQEHTLAVTCLAAASALCFRGSVLPIGSANGFSGYSPSLHGTLGAGRLSFGITPSTGARLTAQKGSVTPSCSPASSSVPKTSPTSWTCEARRGQTLPFARWVRGKGSCLNSVSPPVASQLGYPEMWRLNNRDDVHFASCPHTSYGGGKRPTGADCGANTLTNT